jgi:hypothetical protein
VFGEQHECRGEPNYQLVGEELAEVLQNSHEDVLSHPTGLRVIAPMSLNVSKLRGLTSLGLAGRQSGQWKFGSRRRNHPQNQKMFFFAFSCIFRDTLEEAFMSHVFNPFW